MTVTQDTLAPCPFCGSSSVGFKDHGLPDTQAGCNDCGATVPWKQSRAEAIAAWNTRTASARIEQLEATLARQAEALEPFASVAEWDIGEEEDDDDLFRVMMGGHNYAPLLRVGDLRRAREAWETRHDL